MAAFLTKIYENDSNGDGVSGSKKPKTASQIFQLSWYNAIFFIPITCG